MPFNDDESMGNDIQEVSAGDERGRKKKIDDIRLETAKSIKKARLMADDNQLEEAKDIIVNAQSSLDNEDFNELDTLKSDLQRLLTLMKTQETYEKQGRAFALPRETSHDSHDLAERGNEGPSCGTGKTKLRIITKREAPLEETKFNVMLELSSNETTPGLDLVTVLDISGSMQGEKLEKMKSAMQLVIEKLSAIDRLSVVTFDSHSNTLCPLHHMTKDSKAGIKKRVSDLSALGGTNISAGLKKGLQVLKDDCLTSRRWVAIMLLCDGEQDPQDPGAAKVEVGNVPVYTFGLGSYYDPEVLKAIANESSGGMFTDVQNVDELSIEFSQCLEGLLRLVVQDLNLTITQENSTKIEKVSAEKYRQYRGDIGSVIVPLGHLYEKDQRKVTVDLLLPACSSTKCVEILNISYTYSFRGKQIRTKPRSVTITRRNSAPMINESRVVTDKQLEIANKMIIEAQKLLQNVIDETLNSEVQQLKRLMNSQKLNNQQETDEETIDEVTVDEIHPETAESGERTIRSLENSRATTLGDASTVHSNNNDLKKFPIEFLLDRTGVRQRIPESLNSSNNYVDWSGKVKKYLEEFNVQKVIDEPLIETTESIEIVDIRTAIQKLKQFRENWIALILINHACGFPINLQINDLDFARKAWNTLATNRDPGNLNLNLTFFSAVERDDWKKVKQLLDSNHELATARIPSSQNTVLHLASLAGKVNIVKKLVGLMEAEALEGTDKDGYTALANASINGDKRIAQYMVQKNMRLVSIPTGTKLIPVVIAAMNGHKQMTSYLYEVTPVEDLTNNDNKGNINGATLLTYSIRMQLYDISLGLIKKYPGLAVALDHNGQSALYQLACTPSAFHSGSQLKFWKKLTYVCVRDIDWDINHTRLSIPDEDVSQSNRWNAGYRGIWKQIASRLLAVLGIRCINKRKLVYDELLRCICGDRSNLNKDEVVNGIINGLHEAVAKGAVKLIADVLENLPELRRFRDKQGSTIFMKAVEFRQEGVFSLLQGFAYKDKMIDWLDESGENILHKLKYNSADKISKIQGAVLKMQKELQWLEEIEPMMSPASFKKKNNKGQRPRQLFRNSHKKLMIDAEKWMYNTANSCIIVGVLVVTITFAAAFTVPGGNDQTTGFPLFLRKKLFKIFIISDAVSLFSSTTSVLIFLGILSSRYAEKDFLISLPTKMIFGLFSLFLSIATMMLAFAVTLFMMLHAEAQSKLPVILSSLAAFPLMLYAISLFPLLFEFTMSTYGPSIFHRKSKIVAFFFLLSRKVKWLLTE